MYLAFILALSALSVLLTIIVLMFHFRSNEDQDMSSGIKTFCHLLMKITFWKRPLCCKRKVNPAGEETTDITVVTQADEKDFLKSKQSVNSIDVTCSPSPSEHLEPEDELTWQIFAKVLDHFFFLIFIFTITLVTFMLVCMLIHKYINY